MAASTPNGHEFRVVYSGEVREELKALAARAREQGLVPEFLAAVKAIDASLRSDPTGFGDPYNELSAARLTVYSRILHPLVVTYSVHRHKPIVFVRAFRPYPADVF